MGMYAEIQIVKEGTKIQWIDTIDFSALFYVKEVDRYCGKEKSRK